LETYIPHDQAHPRSGPMRKRPIGYYPSIRTLHCRNLPSPCRLLSTWSRRIIICRIHGLDTTVTLTHATRDYYSNKVGAGFAFSPYNFLVHSYSGMWNSKALRVVTLVTLSVSLSDFTSGRIRLKLLERDRKLVFLHPSRF